MSDALFRYWPAIVAGIVGAAVPRRDSVKLRAGLGFIAAFLVFAVQALWPEDPSAAHAAPSEWPHLLNVLIFLPLIGAAAVLFMPRQLLGLLRAFTLGVLGLGFVLSLMLLTVPMSTGWHFVSIHEWIPAFGIRWHVAVDGISLWLILLTTFMTPIAVYAAFGSIKTRIKEFCFAFLLLQGAMIGAFVSLDLFQFYMFWELMLVPMYVMIGIWGGADKVKASVKFFLYTMTGSMLMLAAIVYLVWTHQKLTNTWSFDYLALSRVVLPGPSAAGGGWQSAWQVTKSPQGLCFWAFSIAFFIKVPMWPLHTWLPDAHVQAPTGGSVILAAVMLKLGTYAYMRFSMGLFPGPASSFAANLAGIAILGGVIYGALVAWKQQDVKRLVAYSSVAHLGYVMLGLFGVSPSGMQGAVLQMVNHGVSTGALFLLVGVIYDRRHTRMVDEFGGLAKQMPIYAALFLIVTFASIGVPGTNGFVGEFMVIMGTYTSERLSTFSGIHTVGASAGVILAAVYMLGVVQKIFFGPLTNPKNKNLPDLTVRETLAVAPLIVMIFVIGFFPSIFLDRTKDAVQLEYNQFKTVSEQSIRFGDEKNAQMLPEDDFSPAFLRGAPGFKEDEKPADGAEQARGEGDAQ
ncbi:MAG: NADH-quinone oxidoreductase subunit M [Byssovorax sp.]